MGDNQKRIKVTVAATNNEFTLSAGELIAKTRDILLDQRRSDIVSATWETLSENDQRSEVERLTEYAENLVNGIVEIVAAGNFDVIHAKLDNFKIKDGDVTVTSKGRASDGALLALNSVGVKALKIIVADDEQFDQHRDAVAIDADEPEMFGDEPEDDGNILDPETGELKPASDDTTQAVIDAVEDDLSDEEKAANHEERMKNAHAFGRGSFDEHQDADQNPYFEDEDDDLRNAWFNGFYERKNEVEPGDGGDDQPEENQAETSDDAGVESDDQTEETPTDNGDSSTDPAETQPETSSEPSEAYQAGMQHRSEDGSRDENPHDGGTDEHLDWQAGFDKADKEIAELFNAGYEAAEAGKTEDDSGWKKGSDPHKRWMFGFERWHRQNSDPE